MAALVNVKTVVLTRLSRSSAPQDDYKRFVDELNKHFLGDVIVAEDVMEFLTRFSRQELRARAAWGHPARSIATSRRRFDERHPSLKEQGRILGY